MSSGAADARRDARRQQRLIAEQRRETQKAQRKEEDIKSRSLKSAERRRMGRASLLDQLASKLGAGSPRATSGGGAGGAPLGSSGREFFSNVGSGSLIAPPASTGTVTMSGREVQTAAGREAGVQEAIASGATNVGGRVVKTKKSSANGKTRYS